MVETTPATALRQLASHMAVDWADMLGADPNCGLGHLNDLWKAMYEDMEALTCLMKFISDHDSEAGLGCDFRPILGFPHYGGHSTSVPKNNGKEKMTMKQIRELLDMSQRKCAKALGVTAGFYGYVERGVNRLPERWKPTLLKLWGVSDEEVEWPQFKGSAKK